MKDTHISILQYIKSGQVSIENEISNLRAGFDINIKIRDFFANSPDYQKLQTQVLKAQEAFEQATDMQERLALSAKLNNLRELEKEFKTDVLRLADVFSKMELRTERLRQAAALFEEGKFREADAILKEQDLANDQHNLIILADYLELQLENLWTKLKNIIDNEQSN